MILHRPDLPLSGEHSVGNRYATVRRCRRCGIVIGLGDRCDLCVDPGAERVDAPGWYEGRHHTEWVPTVDELLAQGDDDAAEFLLLKLIAATEAEALDGGAPPFERHFRRLAQIARRRADRQLEAEVLARYERCARQVRPEARPLSP